MGVRSLLKDSQEIEIIKLENRALELIKERDYYKGIVDTFMDSLGKEVNNEFIRRLIAEGKGKVMAVQLMRCSHNEVLGALNNCKTCEFSKRKGDA